MQNLMRLMCEYSLCLFFNEINQAIFDGDLGSLSRKLPELIHALDTLESMAVSGDYNEFQKYVNNIHVAVYAKCCAEKAENNQEKHKYMLEAQFRWRLAEEYINSGKPNFLLDDSKDKLKKILFD